MTNEELEQFVKDLMEHYGDNLPNPDHEPLRFQYYIKLFMHVKGR